MDLFAPGVGLGATLLNAYVRDRINIRAWPTSWGEFDDATTQTITSTTAGSWSGSNQADPALAATDEQWQKGFGSVAFTSSPIIYVSGLYAVTCSGQMATGTGDWACWVKLETSGPTITLATGCWRGGDTMADRFSLTTIHHLTYYTEVRAYLQQNSGSSRNLDRFGLWLTRLAA